MFNICIVGLGYVGLPLAVEFAKTYDVIGYDTNKKRINELKAGYDATGEINDLALKESTSLSFTSDLDLIKSCNVYIVAVPTPIDEFKQPNMGPLRSASSEVASVLKLGDLVIYESTVYPGATEEVCIPILEELSGLKHIQEFSVGYSPERINPGDQKHTLPNITKITSGATLEIGEIVDKLYASIIHAGTHLAPNIRVAEAAKVIENTQRDLNIALINELAYLFDRLGIDTTAVLDAAATKWNFLKFQPGLVGGHCIGVDPYYLTYKAQQMDFYPELVLAGRRINEKMGEFITKKLIKEMIRRKIAINDSRVLVLGFTFKEDCPDIRNTRVIDVVRELEEYGVVVDVFDTVADQNEVFEEHGITPVNNLNPSMYDAIVIAVKHRLFGEIGIEKIRSCGKHNSVIFDVKGLFSRDEIDLTL